MKFIGKILVAPFALALGLVYGFFKFVVILGGAVILMFYAGFLDGLIFLIIAAVVFGLPYLAALMVGALGAANSALWGFIKS